MQEIGSVDGNINSLKYHKILAAQNTPDHKRGQFFQQAGAPSNTLASKVPESGQGAPELVSLVTRHEHY